ncbi:hypothetical protein PRIPAC_79621, partial [Pristionchus pacificus]|uniref:G protein-coupled receptor n=1 Tax=Pristionchus pacificus TaxID=54126 RepID=A0A2A6CKD8_PRIPA
FLLHLLIAGNAIFLNGLLLFAAFPSLPKASLSYAVLTKIQAIADLISSAIVLTTMHRSVPCEWSLIFVAYGPCSLFGSTACYYRNAVVFGAYSVSVGVHMQESDNNSTLSQRNMYVISNQYEISMVRNMYEIRNQYCNVISMGVTYGLMRYRSFFLRKGQSSSLWIAACILSFFAFFHETLAKILHMPSQKKNNMSNSTRMLHQQFVKSNELPALLSPIIIFTHIGHYS